MNMRVRGRPLDRSRANLTKNTRRWKISVSLMTRNPGMLRFVFLFVLEEFRERGIEPRRDGIVRRFFVVNSGDQRSVRFRQSVCRGSGHPRRSAMR